MRRPILATILFASVVYAAGAPQVKTPSAFSEQTNAQGTNTAKAVAQWWTTFNDPELSALIGRAIASNLDVKLAAERLIETRAARRITRSNLLPSVDSNTSFQRVRGGFEDGNIHVGQNSSNSILVSPFESNLFQSGFDASWEIDLFGGRRHELRAATAEVRVSEEQWRDTLVSLVAEVARTYTDLRGAQRHLGITQQNIVLQQDTLHLAEVRAQAGLGNQLDVERQKEQLEQTRALVPTFTDEIHRDVHAMSVLLAQPPSELESELEAEAPLPVIPPQVPVGLPSDLLKRRPDLRAAQAELDAASERVGAAKADLFPKIFLSGTAGRQATEFSGFTLGGGNFFSVGPAITVPLFEGGRIRANIAVKKEQYQEAVTRYQQTALAAFQDTEDSLSAYGREQDRRERLQAAVASSKQATELATELYTRGLSDFLSVLEAQRDQLAAEDALVASDTGLVSDLVSLYKALGGGWETVAPASN